MKLYDCKTNGRLEPIGLEPDRLCFQRKLPQTSACEAPVSFRLGIASSREKLTAGCFDVWLAEGTGQTYTLPEALEPYTVYWWKVTACGHSGQPLESDACSFETGAPFLRLSADNRLLPKTKAEE